MLCFWGVAVVVVLFVVELDFAEDLVYLDLAEEIVVADKVVHLVQLEGKVYTDVHPAGMTGLDLGRR